jgi:hypothetical protein
MIYRHWKIGEDECLNADARFLRSCLEGRLGQYPKRRKTDPIRVCLVFLIGDFLIADN